MPKELPQGYGKDRIVAMVRDPYWVHAYWEVTRQAVQRAEAALGQEWYGARPILRVLDVTSNDMTSSAESIVTDITIHGGCNNWYLNVGNPRSYRIDIGYLSKSGTFYVLARSNVVTTPRAGVSDVIDENWSDFDSSKADRIFAMSAGFDPSASSLELKQFSFEERGCVGRWDRRRSPASAPGRSSSARRTAKFWFQAWTPSSSSTGQPSRSREGLLSRASR